MDVPERSRLPFIEAFLKKIAERYGQADAKIGNITFSFHITQQGQSLAERKIAVKINGAAKKEQVCSALHLLNF